MEERSQDHGTHKFSLNRRKEASLTGIKDVIAFDEKEIRLESDCGLITVKGEGLHVKQLTLENGEAKLEGRISEISYSDEKSFVKNGQTLFDRLFR